MEPFYYSQMNKIQQSAYHAMKTGLLALAPSFAVPKLEGRELTDIFFRLRLDLPDIFYGTGFHYRFYPDSTNVEMIPEYLFEKGKIEEHKKAMNARIAKLVRQVQSLSEWEKEKYIHDFICENVRYDKLKKFYSHEIIGPLGQGVGVCEGIAKTVKILCDALGIWCIIAISDSNPDKKIKYRHAWNIVRIDGVFHHLDATFDNSLGQGELVRYDYFNLSDQQIFRDHEPVMYPVPVCPSGDLFYYRVKKMSFTKTEDVEKRAVQAIRKKTALIFHWRGGYLNKELLSEILNLLGETAGKKEKHASVSLNFTQAIFAVRFVDAVSESELILEDANEGEQM